MVDAPNKPHRQPTLPLQPRVPFIDTRSSLMPEPDREFLLKTFREQTREFSEQTSKIVDKLDSLESTTKSGFDAHERRLLDLEKQQLEERRTGLLVQEMNGKFDMMIAANRAQDLDIGRLSAQVTTSLRPFVKSEANAEGQDAGSAAGKRQGKIWGIVTIVVGIVVTTTLNYCSEQIKNYNGATAPPASSAPH